MNIEDKRAAVGISITLTTQLISAALAMLSVEGAYIVFALGSRNVIHPWFELTATLTAISLVMSIYSGGEGATKSRNSGFLGNWDLSNGKNEFNKQALFCCAGIFLFAITLLLSGSSQQSSLEKSVSSLERQIKILDMSVEQIQSKIHNIERNL